MKLNGNLYRVIDVTQGDGSCIFRIELNPEHWIKDCHFPGNPIVPGVFLLGMVTELLEEKMGYPLYIKEIKNVKFINIMSPRENSQVSLKFSGMTDLADGIKVQTVISSALDPAKLFARMSMTLQKERV